MAWSQQAKLKCGQIYKQNESGVTFSWKFYIFVFLLEVESFISLLFGYDL